MRQLRALIVCLLAILTACTGPGEQVAQVPTATLAFIVTRTPRFTATPVPTRTPLPTFTFTPSITPIPPTPTLSPTPTEEPPIIGIVTSLETVNIREGPGGSFGAIAALKPGTGVEVLGKNPDETWYNIEFENEDGFKVQGWIFARLLRVQPSPTPIPSATPSPDLTKLFLGTPLPTALFGGGTVTPTPPRSVVTATPPTAVSATITATAETVGIPVIDLNAINQTATALSIGVVIPTTSSAPTSTPGAPTTPVTLATPAPGTAVVREKVNVFALCDDPNQRLSPPQNLAAGSTIVVWWAWIAREESQMEQHLSAATYEVRVDGVLLTNVEAGQGRIIARAADHIVYWYVPYLQPLSAGQHRITYRVTWSVAITDGFAQYGPGTNHPVEEGSCTFTVR